MKVRNNIGLIHPIELNSPNEHARFLKGIHLIDRFFLIKRMLNGKTRPFFHGEKRRQKSNGPRNLEPRESMLITKHIKEKLLKFFMICFRRILRSIQAVMKKSVSRQMINRY